MNIPVSKARAVSAAALVAGGVTATIALYFWYAEASYSGESLGVGYVIAVMLGGLACVTALMGGIGLAIAGRHPLPGTIVASVGIAICALPWLVLGVGLLPA